MGRLGRSCHVSGLFCPPKAAVIVLLLGVVSTAFALGKEQQLVEKITKDVSVSCSLSNLAVSYIKWPLASFIFRLGFRIHLSRLAMPLVHF